MKCKNSLIVHESGEMFIPTKPYHFSSNSSPSELIAVISMFVSGLAVYWHTIRLSFRLHKARTAFVGVFLLHALLNMILYTMCLVIILCCSSKAMVVATIQISNLMVIFNVLVILPVVFRLVCRIGNWRKLWWDLYFSVLIFCAIAFITPSLFSKAILNAQSDQWSWVEKWFNAVQYAQVGFFTGSTFATFAVAMFVIVKHRAKLLAFSTVRSNELENSDSEDKFSKSIERNESRMFNRLMRTRPVFYVLLNLVAWVTVLIVGFLLQVDDIWIPVENSDMDRMHLRLIWQNAIVSTHVIYIWNAVVCLRDILNEQPALK